MFANAIVELTERTRADKKVLVLMFVVLFCLVSQKYGTARQVKSITTTSPNERNKTSQNEYSIFILASLLPNQILDGSNRMLSDFSQWKPESDKDNRACKVTV